MGWLKPLLAISCALVGCGKDEPIPKGELVLQSEAFALGPGEERYDCWAHTLTEDAVVDRIDYDAQPTVHHLIFARATAPEPEGLSHCNILFRASWIPMFGATTADASVQMPEGAATFLPKGTQVVASLHLLNSSPAATTGRFGIRLRRSALAEPDPVGLVAFGKLELELPPKQKSISEHTCTLDSRAEVFAVLPHMHYLGQSLRLDVGPNDAQLAEVFRRQPWDFDDQRIEPAALTLEAGTRVRVSCAFDNPHAHTVSFGESSLDEMCFLLAFARGRHGIEGCQSLPVTDAGLANPDAGVCGAVPANSIGVGAPCTKGGGQCAQGLACTLDQAAAPSDSAGFCIKVGCTTNADCGDGSVTCCAPAQAGGLIRICMPEACRPSDCLGG